MRACRWFHRRSWAPDRAFPCRGGAWLSCALKMPQLSWKACDDCVAPELSAPSSARSCAIASASQRTPAARLTRPGARSAFVVRTSRNGRRPCVRRLLSELHLPNHICSLRAVRWSLGHYTWEPAASWRSACRLTGQALRAGPRRSAPAPSAPTTSRTASTSRSTALRSASLVRPVALFPQA